ncbi:DivIVA domain-containing protein [Gordonia shandongensis]|uniref:DivIVA domain-containing protein n=1 Tax=Gordonia shandongensis TaxID=376351 RepID=UPI000412CA4E|nr:DivIVA domain-containing protein [Gordonia shandongensis]
MVTIGLYVMGVAGMVAVLFLVVWFAFGRGEELPPLDRGTTLTRLPRAGITGDDVRSVIFAQTFRGYRASEVDWTLEKLAREIDELRAVVHDLQAREDIDAGSADTGPIPIVRPE